MNKNLAWPKKIRIDNKRLSVARSQNGSFIINETACYREWSISLPTQGVMSLISFLSSSCSDRKKGDISRKISRFRDGSNLWLWENMCNERGEYVWAHRVGDADNTRKSLCFPVGSRLQGWKTMAEQLEEFISHPKWREHEDPKGQPSPIVQPKYGNMNSIINLRIGPKAYCYLQPKLPINSGRNIQSMLPDPSSSCSRNTAASNNCDINWNQSVVLVMDPPSDEWPEVKEALHNTLNSDNFDTLPFKKGSAILTTQISSEMLWKIESVILPKTDQILFFMKRSPLCNSMSLEPKAISVKLFGLPFHL